jgi:hypothetical protein
MSSQRTKSERNHNREVQTPRERKLLPIGAAVVGAVILAVGIPFMLRKDAPSVAKKSAPLSATTTTGAIANEAPPPALVPIAASVTATPPKGTASANGTSAGSEAMGRFGVLRGKWLRPDGGYVVEITNVSDSGTMDASYFNPRRIKVSKAEASRDGATIKVFIELRDVNYPGSTYSLTYNPQSDQLEGIYYQAALQQQFEVFFVRRK